MALQIIGVLLAGIGLIANPSLVIIGGLICVMIDIIGFLSGKMNPLFPAFAYFIGYTVTNSIIGIFYASILLNLLEVIPVIIANGNKKICNLKKQKKISVFLIHLMFPMKFFHFLHI